MTGKGSCIDPDMTVLDIVSAHKKNIEVFKEFDGRAGACICCTSLFISLRDVAEKYRLDLYLLLSELEKAAEKN
jgi:hypothetical protein